MGKQQPREYYDRIFESSVAYSADAENTPWTPIWKLVTEQILSSRASSIYDFGCGCGHLCQLVYRRGYSGSYVGVDFSSVAIMKSIQRNFSNRKATFLTEDISELNLDEVIKDPTTSWFVLSKFKILSCTACCF